MLWLSLVPAEAAGGEHSLCPSPAQPWGSHPAPIASLVQEGEGEKKRRQPRSQQPHRDGG